MTTITDPVQLFPNRTSNDPSMIVGPQSRSAFPINVPVQRFTAGTSSGSGSGGGESAPTQQWIG